MNHRRAQLLRRLIGVAALVTGFATWVVPGAEAASSPPAPDFIGANADALRTSWFPDEAALPPSQINSRDFGEQFSQHLDGQVFAEPLKQPAYGGLQPPEHLLLQTVGNSAHQQVAADALGRFAAVQQAPPFFQVGNGKLRQNRELRCEVAFLYARDLLHVVCPSLGSHTHCSAAPTSRVADSAGCA